MRVCLLALACLTTVWMVSSARAADPPASPAASAFAQADAALNVAWQRLRERVPPDTFATLRDNQRAWLRYRDRFVADGDDSASHGPGSEPFLLQQTARTVARTAFLDALARTDAGGDGSGRYSDGIERELRLRVVEGPRSRALFVLAGPAHDPRGVAGFDRVLLAGSATAPDGSQAWTGDGDAMRATPATAAVSEVLIEITPDGREALTSSASHTASFDGHLFRVGALRPADEPMAELLRRVPVQLFDDTTEGLSEQDRAALLRTGRAAGFALAVPMFDSLQVRYDDGRITLQRFGMDDGDALLAAITRNGRATSIAFWRIGVADAVPVARERLLAWPPPAAFGMPQADPATALFEVEPLAAAGLLRVRWRNAEDGRDSGRFVDMAWDGTRFAPLRTENAP